MTLKSFKAFGEIKISNENEKERIDLLFDIYLKKQTTKSYRVLRKCIYDIWWGYGKFKWTGLARYLRKGEFKWSIKHAKRLRN